MNVRFDARAALIDLDGTLVDSLPDIANAINAMRGDLGYPAMAVEQIATYVGKGADVLVHRTLTESMEAQAAAHLFARGKQSFYRHYAAVNGNASRVYAGTPEALQNLRSKDIKLACVTNKPRQFTVQLLERIGLHTAFGAIVTGDDTHNNKPHAEPMLRACELLGVAVTDAVVIGDSDNDVLSARAAGCRVIAVETGYNEGRSVCELDADAIVPSLLHAARLIELRLH
ncbi:MAG: phosphoglycolate phosphatase [Burkholderiaceae bacterium]